jgi:signal transduction histidine kinase
VNVVAASRPPAPDSSLARWQRWLLPTILGFGDVDRSPEGGVDLPRSVRDWLVDFMLFGFAVLVGLAALFSNRHQVGTAMLVVDGVLGLPAWAALWVRRRHPLAVGWLTVSLATVSGTASGAAIVGLFTVAVYCAPRRTLQLALLSIVTIAVYSWIYETDSHYDVGGLVFGILLTIATVAFGSFVRVRRELVLSLRERARRLEAEQGLRVREAQLAERARIAREMHDVLAHRISLLSVHAGAIEFNPNASPEEIARAAAVIRVSARAAQEELREVIGVLRADSEPGAVQPPQPTVADLTTLVEESRNAGMDVSLSLAVADEPLAPTLGRTVYRLVQEALTNARKHAPGQVVSIVIVGDHLAGMNIEVTNRPTVGRASETGDDGADDLEPGGTGTGLVGLAERVTLAGGRLTHEPLPDGGFRLIATLAWADDGEVTDEP